MQSGAHQGPRQSRFTPFVDLGAVTCHDGEVILAGLGNALSSAAAVMSSDDDDLEYASFDRFAPTCDIWKDERARAWMCIRACPREKTTMRRAL